MRKSVIGPLAAGLLVLSAGATANSADLQATARLVPVDLTYDLYLGGIKAGELSMTARYEGARYRAVSTLETAGIVGRLYKAWFRAESQGRMTPDGFVPDRFTADSGWKKKRQALKMTYGATGPREVRGEPAFVPKPWEIEPAAQSGTMDPITAALSALAPLPIEQVCNTRVEIFDGRKRYAVELGEPRRDGERIECPAVYHRVAGFKPKMLRKGREFPFTVWFEKRRDGLAHVVRAAGESRLGLAVALLRK